MKAKRSMKAKMNKNKKYNKDQKLTRKNWMNQLLFKGGKPVTAM